MTKQETIAKVNEKYQEQIDDMNMVLEPLMAQRLSLEAEWKNKLMQVEEYFNAIEKIEAMQQIIDNPPEI